MGAGRKPGPNAQKAHQSSKIRVNTDDAECYVYVIYEIDEPNVCKIGVATNLATRLSAMQTGTWRILKIAHAVRLPSRSSAHAIERQVHQALSALHCRGEWFRVPVDRAAREVDLAVDQLRAAIVAAWQDGEV